MTPQANRLKSILAKLAEAKKNQIPTVPVSTKKVDEPKVDPQILDLTFTAEVQIAEEKLQRLIRTKHLMQAEKGWTAKDFRSLERRIGWARNRLSAVCNKQIKEGRR